MDEWELLVYVAWVTSLENDCALSCALPQPKAWLAKVFIDSSLVNRNRSAAVGARE